VRACSRCNTNTKRGRVHNSRPARFPDSFDAWTDAPWPELGEREGKRTSGRCIAVLAYDGDKRLLCECSGYRREISRGLVYKSPVQDGTQVWEHRELTDYILPAAQYQELLEGGRP
jgi:hypothetical protein